MPPSIASVVLLSVACESFRVLFSIWGAYSSPYLIDFDRVISTSNSYRAQAFALTRESISCNINLFVMSKVAVPHHRWHLPVQTTLPAS